VPKEFTVKMSANQTSLAENENSRIFKFDNQIKVPSYLIALAIGDLERQPIGARTGVITEPAGMAAAVSELQSLETYLDEVEKYVGVPYAWGHYDVLVLPPSFPFGGMENPLLTFLSPTMITGDKSQIATAIHEVGHSWMGNLVTCKTWEDVWLNESPTVFIQRKITEKIYGKERSSVES
jgi:leukotriene-A4 hydrolase